MIDEDLAARPVGVIRIPTPNAAPRNKPHPDLECVTFPVDAEEASPTVDESFTSGKIPEEAQQLAQPAELGPGVELFAYHLADTATEGGILDVSTWWRVTGPVSRNAMPAFHISPEGDTPRRGTPWYTRHDAADWTVPLQRVDPGTVIEDRYPARLAGLPVGPCKVYAVVIDTTRPEGKRILAEPRLLGKVKITPKAKD